MSTLKKMGKTPAAKPKPTPQPKAAEPETATETTEFPELPLHYTAMDIAKFRTEYYRALAQIDPKLAREKANMY